MTLRIWTTVKQTDWQMSSFDFHLISDDKAYKSVHKRSGVKHKHGNIVNTAITNHLSLSVRCLSTASHRSSRSCSIKSLSLCSSVWSVCSCLCSDITASSWSSSPRRSSSSLRLSADSDSSELLRRPSSRWSSWFAVNLDKQLHSCWERFTAQQQ